MDNLKLSSGMLVATNKRFSAYVIHFQPVKERLTSGDAVLPIPSKNSVRLECR